MKLSYWEYKTWLTHIDFTIVGSGITGLNCALQLRKRFPAAKILILEKGSLPQGASTKNAGFACFGSISEILDDLQSHSEAEVLQLVQKRWQGMAYLRETIGDKQLDFKQWGGYEIFGKNDADLLDTCADRLPYINQLLDPIFNQNAFRLGSNNFGFKGVQNTYIVNTLEGQLDPGKMMAVLLKKVQQKDIYILNGVEVENIEDSFCSVSVSTKQFEFTTGKLLIATNGFASRFIADDIKPARAQVLLTEPLKTLHVKGTFHLDRGYYYFRNIGNRILLGGGRNLDFSGEETSEFGNTDLIQNKLEELLQHTILPESKVKVEHRWSGIMGVGKKKRPIIEQLSDNVFCGVRLGGMGVAIGSLVGAELAELV